MASNKDVLLSVYNITNFLCTRRINIKQWYEGHLQYPSFMTHVHPSSQPFILDLLFEVFFALPFPENIHILNGLIC